MQLEPLVRRVLAPNPSPYTYTGTQSYIVGIGDGCAVIDPGPDETEHLLALDAAIGEEHVCAIMCTHTHRDHSPAARTLAARTGAPNRSSNVSMIQFSMFPVFNLSIMFIFVVFFIV